MKLDVHRGQTYEYTDPATGQAFFSVSQVRKTMHDTFANVPGNLLEEARLRGKRLHTYFALYLLSRIDCAKEPKPLLGLEGYCDAIRTWQHRNQVEPVRVEEPSLNRKLRIAGTPDAQVLYGRKRILTLTDLKTGQETPTDGVQLQAYKTMDDYQDSRTMLDLYIHADGTYKEVERKPCPHTWAAFLGAISILHWRAL